MVAAQTAISNYIKWFKWIQMSDTDKEIIKAKKFYSSKQCSISYGKVKDLKNRELIYVYHMWYFANYVIISIIKKL